jgi:hypothetical protein
MITCSLCPETPARARLRRRMEEAVERLIAALDAFDAPYTDLEPDADAEPEEPDSWLNPP